MGARGTAHPARRSSPASVLLCAALGAATLAPASPAAAWTRPALVAEGGGTFAVLGTLDQGGLSAALSALWPVDLGFVAPERVRFGVTGFAGDLGASLGPLADPAQPGVDLGTTEVAHRWARGVAWRMDASLPGRWGWTPVATGTWGLYHVTDDHRGAQIGKTESTGFSVGGGLRRALHKNATVGAALRYHRLFNDTAGRYASAGVEYGW
jgi:hypothetical protein